ncbi:hypothetical protein [Trujillonella endophytica]|uniref:Uncharacterized protein n=1 Tax=Trujillonella endophytica TaxID=673521 RepID=A0A1H8SLK3_9ACTN|nr:hypothetical protein [Trujillella endophytica]SEO79562.1 hypothetical protein SAMN05660991_01818 [Trujillella endophytica]
MASTTLDVPSRDVPACAVARRRPPATVLAAAGIAVVEAVAIVAAALTGLDGLLVATHRPPGALVAFLLLALAAWAVFGAGGGLVLADGSGPRLLTGVAVVELGVLAVAFVLGLTTSSLDGLVPGLPVPAVVLSAVAVPVGKLLLATAPSATAWSDAGPRPRERRPELTEDQRSLRAVTVTVLGFALLAVALLDPGAPTPDVAAPASTGQH